MGVVEKLEYLIKHRGLNTLYTTTKRKIKKNFPPWWSPEQQRNGNGNQAKQRKKKENQDTTTLNTIDNKKLIKDLESKPESVLTYKAKEMEINNETRIKPEDRFEDITFQNPTDWEAFDNLAKDHGIPTLADLEKGENYSAYLIKTDYITEPEPHPYQEILTKENRVAIKEKTQEKEITKEKILKVEKMIPNEEMKKKEIAEKITSTNENITQEIIHKKIVKQKYKITVGEKNQNLGIWKMKKGNAENPEQTQNNTENSKCKLCNEEFASEGRLGIHEAICKEKLKPIVTKDYRDIKKTTYGSPTHKEPTKIKNTEEHIETKILEIKIEKNEPLEIRNTKMKVETKINEVPKKKKKKKKKS